MNNEILEVFQKLPIKELKEKLKLLFPNKYKSLAREELLRRVKKT